MPFDQMSAWIIFTIIWTILGTFLSVILPLGQFLFEVFGQRENNDFGGKEILVKSNDTISTLS